MVSSIGSTPGNYLHSVLFFCHSATGEDPEAMCVSDLPGSVVSEKFPPDPSFG